MTAVLGFEGAEAATFEWPGWALGTFTIAVLHTVTDPLESEATETNLLRLESEESGPILTLISQQSSPGVALDAALLRRGVEDASFAAWGDTILLLITFDQSIEAPDPQAWAHWRNLTQDGAWNHEPLAGFGVYDPLLVEAGEVIVGDASHFGSIGLVGIHGADLWAHDGEEATGPLGDDPAWAGTADLLELDGWLFLRDLNTASDVDLQLRDLDGTDAECLGVSAALTGAIADEEWAFFPGPDTTGWTLFRPYVGDPDPGDPDVWKLHYPDPARWRQVDGEVQVTGQIALCNPGLLLYGGDVIYGVNVPGPILGTTTNEVIPADRVFGLLERAWNPDTAQFVISWSGEIDPDPDPEAYNLYVDHAMDAFPGVATRGLRVDFGGISWLVYTPPSRVLHRLVGGEWVTVTRRRWFSGRWNPPAAGVVPLSSDTVLGANSELVQEGLVVA